MGDAARRETIEGLRAAIAARFRDAVRPATAPRGPALASGWEAVDRSLPGGGLAPGETAVLEGEPGAGGLALASAWAQSAAARGEPVAVLDAAASCLPHAWVEPADTAAPIWVVRPPVPADVWPAADIVLRSGAFGLVILLDPGVAPVGVGPRLVRLARDRDARLIVAGEAPFAPTARVRLRLCAIEWDEGPTGDAPAARAFEARCGTRGGLEAPPGEVRREDARTDRLRPAARAADRRPSSARSGSAARASGRSGRSDRRR